MGEWHVNQETKKRERQVTYKTVTQSILGTNTISCNEKQVCLFYLKKNLRVKREFHLDIRN